MYKLSKQDRLRIEALRGQYAEGLRWYAVHAHTGRECAVRERIARDFAGPGLGQILVPELPDEAAGRRPGLLFGGYVFVQCRMDDALYQGIAELPHIFQVLGLAYRVPQVIPDAEIEHLKGILASTPRPVMVARECRGRQVEVTAGLMKGLRGRLVSLNATQARIETAFSFLGLASGIVVWVARSDLRLVEPAEDRIDVINEKNNMGVRA